MKSDNIRIADYNDLPFVLEMVHALAEYEKAPEAVLINLEQLEKDFKEELFEALIIKWEGQPVGMALYYFRYSTWKGKSLYLEDLFIKPESRGHGLGKKVMYFLADYACKSECGRFEWQVLDWNTPSIEFYKTLGAEIDPEWMNCRLEGKAISELAKYSISKD